MPLELTGFAIENEKQQLHGLSVENAEARLAGIAIGQEQALINGISIGGNAAMLNGFSISGNMAVLESISIELDADNFKLKVQDRNGNEIPNTQISISGNNWETSEPINSGGLLNTFVPPNESYLLTVKALGYRPYHHRFVMSGPVDWEITLSRTTQVLFTSKGAWHTHK